MTIHGKITQLIKDALKALDIPEVSFTLEHPTELSHGDYATNVALVCSKSLGKNPKEVAEMLVGELQKNNIPEVAGITIAGPGFINFKLSQVFFTASISEIITANDQFGKLELYNGKKVLVEHSSPNLFKPFHVGHMMNNAIGESLVRLFQISGAETVALSFPSDVGLGIAKAVYATTQVDNTMLYDAAIPLEAKMKFLGDRYVEGTKAYDESPEAAEVIKKINADIYQGADTPEQALYSYTKGLNMEYFKTTVARLGSEFDGFIFEGEAGDAGKKLVQENRGSVFVESEGAIIYTPAEETKLNTEVFVTSEGHPTYGSKDLGLLKMKFDKYHPDISAVITDYQQAHHFHVVLDAAGKINPIWKSNSQHVPHGRMAFKGQKMSSRLGGVPVATEVLEMIQAELVEKTKDRIPATSANDLDAIAVGAIKFSILRVKPGGAINFDPETSLSFEGDSGPYLQYTHARINSMIEKAGELGIAPKYSVDISETDVERMTYRLPEVAESALLEYSPNYIATYLIDLARAFNSFYGSNKIIDAENPEVSSHRLAIARAVQIVLKNGLGLLGIGAPDRM
jgi:arginyl-tRNA synthetase